MVTVLLYGQLGRKYGKKHQFQIHSAAESIRALCANYKEFKADLIQDSRTFYRLIVDKEDRADETLMHVGVADGAVIKLVPIVQGAGGDFGKVLLGAALIGFALVNPLAAQATVFGSTTVGSIAGSVGFSLVLGGVSGMLFSPPKIEPGSSERPENKPSFAFNGAVNTTGQGNPVPICYGEFLCGSQVISSGLAVDDLPV
jgi:predicted phage tail protein